MGLINCSTRILIVAVLTFVLANKPSEVSAAGSIGASEQLVEDAVTRPRSTPVISPTLESRSVTRPDSKVKVWVFFTDKGVFGRSEFDQATSAITLTDRAKHRRAKVGMDRIVFADLPVSSEYVEAITNLGPTHRRSSRWLNAATFELPARLLQPISDLPFVTEIRPMAYFGRDPYIPDTTSVLRDDSPDNSLSPSYDLDYGASIYQLEQINVPAVHDLGYTGAGVTMAIMDTGNRRTHDALAPHVSAGRILAEYDFVYNDDNTGIEQGDLGSDHYHGTQVWSAAGGYADGELYGPAYQANFILCRTEDLSSETPAEEDNWVAALEFADSVGTDVIQTSLSYMTFDDPADDYTFEDLDGWTTIISAAASTCDGLGIVMINSSGNTGSSGAGSIGPPADAHGILAVGSVDGNGVLAGSSSRGPTYDGRIKPEVCARGVRTRCAIPSGDTMYGDYYGTSFAAPLVAGAACLVIEAHPDWTPAQVREALKETASNAATPDNDYGWGIINTYAAIQYGGDCCTGMVGDANGLGGDEPTLGDVSVIIDARFISGTCAGIIACLAEADINQSGGSDPTCDDLSIGDVSILIDYLFITGPTMILPTCM